MPRKLMWEFFRIEMLKILGTTDSRNPKGQTNNGSFLVKRNDVQAALTDDMNPPAQLCHLFTLS